MFAYVHNSLHIQFVYAIVPALLLSNTFHGCRIQTNVKDIRTMHITETSLPEWEHQRTLREHRRFYKHCVTDVKSGASKTALPVLKCSGLLKYIHLDIFLCPVRRDTRFKVIVFVYAFSCSIHTLNRLTHFQWLILLHILRSRFQISAWRTSILHSNSGRGPTWLPVRRAA